MAHRHQGSRPPGSCRGPDIESGLRAGRCCSFPAAPLPRPCPWASQTSLPHTDAGRRPSGDPRGHGAADHLYSQGARLPSCLALPCRRVLPGAAIRLRPPAALSTPGWGSFACLPRCLRAAAAGLRACTCGRDVCPASQLACLLPHPLSGWDHHHPQLALLRPGCRQLGVRSLGRDEGGGQHRLYAHHLVPLRHDLHCQGRAQRGEGCGTSGTSWGRGSQAHGSGGRQTRGLA